MSHWEVNTITDPKIEDGVYVFRSWSPSINAKHPDIDKLDHDADKVRRQLHGLREHGRQIRLHRLQALDALETRRVTLTEILRRMEKELNERDVYEYGDVLAEVFGERKIFAHRAVGLEALLCQYMHQMLAKQHQLKIMKKAGKDIETHYRKNKLQNKDDFHSFEALCVQLEASRLSLEAIYDEIFASQHRILAQIKHYESGGNMTNYSIPPPRNKEVQPSSHLRSTTSTTTTNRRGDLEDDINPVLTSASSGGDSSKDDLATAMDILSLDYPSRSTATIASATRAIPAFRTANPNIASTTSTATTRNTERRAMDGGKSARERRREIEQKRLAQPSSQRSPLSHQAEDDDDEDEPHKARNRMRELEALAKERRDSSDGKAVTDDDGDLKQRSSRTSRRLVAAASSDY